MSGLVHELASMARLVAEPNTRTVLLGASLLGIAAGGIGAVMVLRRRSLVGDAVAHAGLPGVCLAFIVVGERSLAVLLAGALLFGLLAAAFISLAQSIPKIRSDAAIAISIGVFFGLGIMLSRIIQSRPGGNAAGLDSFIYGKAASMVRSDVLLIAILSIALIGVVVLVRKELKLLCFDRAFGDSLGWPMGFTDYALTALVALCTVVGLPAVGVVLMVALLVIPGAAARFWSDRFETVITVAAILGGVSAAIGTVLSAVVPAPEGGGSLGWPTGPLIVLVAAVLLAGSFLLGPRRGVLAAAMRHRAVKRSVRLNVAPAGGDRS